MLNEETKFNYFMSLTIYVDVIGVEARVFETTIIRELQLVGQHDVNSWSYPLLRICVVANVRASVARFCRRSPSSGKNAYQSKSLGILKGASCSYRSIQALKGSVP